MSARGLKRICLNCETRFYDLNKSPIICPACGTEFTGGVKIKPKRGRPAAEAEKPQAEEQDNEDVKTIDDGEIDADGDGDNVSLDDLESNDDIDNDDDLDDADLDLDELENIDDIDDGDMDDELDKDDL